MTLTEKIPSMSDKDLANLDSNARRLEALNDGAKSKAAAQLRPVIDAEIERRAGAKPAARRAKAKPKAKILSEAALAETDQ